MPLWYDPLESIGGEGIASAVWSIPRFVFVLSPTRLPATTAALFEAVARESISIKGCRRVMEQFEIRLRGESSSESEKRVRERFGKRVKRGLDEVETRKALQVVFVGERVQSGEEAIEGDLDASVSLPSLAAFKMRRS